MFPRMTPDPQAPSPTLILRLAGGAYLLYLAWDLFSSNPQWNLFRWAAILFGLVGAALLFFTLRTLISSGYFRREEETPDPDKE